MTMTLAHRHLLTLALAVDFAAVVRIGTIPGGQRGIAPVTGGSFTGERLIGTVAPGSDWFIARADGSLAIDVRLTLTTADAAAIYLRYQGRMLGRGDAMARFAAGRPLAPDDYSLAITARFECGDPRYAWLNDVIAVGTGEQLPGGVRYTIFEIAP